jgi:hypothetical protein
VETIAQAHLPNQSHILGTTRACSRSCRRENSGRADRGAALLSSYPDSMPAPSEHPASAPGDFGEIYEHSDGMLGHTTMDMHLYPFSMDVDNVATTPIRVKRRQVKNACTNCQSACKKCDDARPCLRCVKYGCADECVSSTRKPRRKGVKRGPYKKRNGARGSFSFCSIYINVKRLIAPVEHSPVDDAPVTPTEAMPLLVPVTSIGSGLASKLAQSVQPASYGHINTVAPHEHGEISSMYQSLYLPQTRIMMSSSNEDDTTLLGQSQHHVSLYQSVLSYSPQYPTIAVQHIRYPTIPSIPHSTAYSQVQVKTQIYDVGQSY